MSVLHSEPSKAKVGVTHAAHEGVAQRLALRGRVNLLEAAAVERLVNDPDVSLHAMSALRKCIGNEPALPILQAVEAGHPDPRVRKQAAQAIKKATKSTGR